MLSQYTREPRPYKAQRIPRWRRLLLLAAGSEPTFRSRRVARRIIFFTLLGLSAVFGSLCGLMFVYSIDLPQMDDLARYRPNTTTELYDVHGRPFGSFALERRVVVSYNDFPPVLREAIISIEDKSFESNWGVNLFRAVGAAWRDLHSQGRAQGASTLTMQLARNLFLSSEKTYARKLQEIFLSVQIERRFTKQQIFELYANQIYLGHGTYGFEAGSEYFFSKHARDLTLPEAALLAALPKGPEAYSPIKYPDRALRRRNLVLTEMEQDGKITHDQAETAKATPLGLHLEPPANSVAPYYVEEVRRQLEKQYGVEQVHGAGLRVDTTIDLDLQAVAKKALLDGTAAYERRHGWKGHLQNIVLEGADIASYKHPDWTEPIEKGSYLHGIVTEVAPRRVTVSFGTRNVALVPADWTWTQNPTADSFLRTGDIVYVRIEAIAADGALTASLQQDSGAQASLMAIDNATGNVLAMIGGRDFALSQFNRATQSQREVGSSFKPYVYTTAIENGAKPSDIIVDGPTTFPTPSGPYTPHDYETGYTGPMTLLNAFAESRNIPALKLADRYGIRKVIETAHRFGVTSNIPAFLPVAIGSADISLEEQVAAYSVFPNDGIRIEPRYIRSVTQADGLPLDAPSGGVTEAISVDTARTMMQLLQAVVRQGTAAAASQLKHPLGGKTGTTNDFTDAWFIGFSPSVTCGVWVGYDDHQSLGEKETGAKAALPIWMDFMRAAIAGKPNEAFPVQGAPKKAINVAGGDTSLNPTSGSSASATPATPSSASPNRQTASPAATEPHPHTSPEDQPHPAIPAAPKQETTPEPEHSPATPQQPAPAPAPAAPKGSNEHTGVSNPPPDTD